MDNDSNRRSWPRRMLNRAEVDRAVFYAVLGRAWQFLAGPVTMLLIASYFTPELQGYFYTFWSLLALQTFAELGLANLLTHLASHEWAKLRVEERGRLAGEPEALSRLVSLGRLALRWYVAAGLLFAVATGAAGLVFFSQESRPGIDWMAPWLAVVALSGLSLMLLPFYGLLEGCNQAATINKYRIVQVLSGHLLVWVLIPLGAELWVAAAAVGARLFWECHLAFVRYRGFFAQLLQPPGPHRVNWNEEVWPLQWRLAVQSVFGYFIFYLFTPVMFHYHGPVTAGRMGMTWHVLTILPAASIAWVQTRIARFGLLIAQGAFRELDRVFNRLTTISVTVLATGGLAFWAAVVVLNGLADPSRWPAAGLPPAMAAFAEQLASRLLPPLPTGILAAAVILFQIAACQGIYIRAHKKDPLLPITVVSYSLAGLLIWLLGKEYGPLGAAAGYLGVIGALYVPVHTAIWLYCRREWHRESPVEKPQVR